MTTPTKIFEVVKNIFQLFVIVVPSNHPMLFVSKSLYLKKKIEMQKVAMVGDIPHVRRMESYYSPQRKNHVVTKNIKRKTKLSPVAQTLPHDGHASLVVPFPILL